MSDLEGLVFDVQRFSIHDGPGIRTTVFLKGCPLACAWCHNPESQSFAPEVMASDARCIRCHACVRACPDGALRVAGDGPVETDRALCRACGTCVDVCPAEARERVGERRTVAEVMERLRRDRPFYETSGGGVTFSGGEPLAQPEFLGALLRASRAEGLHTAVDTSGYAPWAVLDSVRGAVDLFLYDLKLMDEAKHRRSTGVSNAPILANLRALADRGHRVVVRVPVVEGVNDDAGEIEAIAAFAAGMQGVEAVELLAGHHFAAAKYRRLGRPAPAAGPTAAERIAAAADRMRRHRLTVRTGA